MRTTIANLKHLYQCQAFWAFYLAFAVFTWPLADVLERGSPLVWFHLLMSNLMAGLGFGLLQQEILSRPFVYCLPGHRPIPRRLIFGFGVVVNLVLSLFIVVRRDLSSYNVPVIMAAVFSFGLTWYLLVAAFFCTVRERHAYALAVLPVFPVIFAAKSVDDLVLRMPALFVFIGIITCGGTWTYLRGDRLARRHAGRPTNHFSGLGQAARRTSRHTVSASSSLTPRWVQTFFYARIGAYSTFSAARYICADLYVAFAALLSWWKRILLMCLPAALVLAFMAGKVSPAGTDNFSLKFPAVSGIILLQVVVLVSLMPTFQMPIPVFSTMLLTRGRRERFTAMISIAVAMALFISCLLIFVTVCTSLLQLIAPGTFGSLTRLFGGLLTVGFVAAPFALVPLGLAARLIAKYRDVTIVRILALCIFILILTVRYWFAWIGVPLLVAAAACSWMALLLATHRICTRRSFAR